MNDAEKQKAREEGLAIKELQRQSGWKILQSRIEAKKASAVAELRRIELEGRSLQDIGAEYVSHIKLIDGLDQVFQIVRDIEAKKEEVDEEQNNE